MSYNFRNRTWCSGSNTAPSRAERDEALENNRRFQCQECGRAVTLTQNGLVPTHLAALVPMKAEAPERKPRYAQEVMLRVSWSVLNHKDGQPQHIRRGEVMLDLGLEAAPDPELTADEMQQVAFAAKIAVLKAIGKRARGARR